ncbi:MAG: alpha/beta hydrolase [Steroidobacteraceae bacterium]|nr:alpha/beta hydrolase [Steroidobacteraceae bacterium]
MESSPALAAWLATGQRVRLLGHELFTRASCISGRKPLLLIHGFPTASYDWHRVWPALAARYSLYTCDLLGFGLSDKPRGASYPIPQQADLCEAMLAHFGVDRPHVLAHDYGDTVAQELLARELEGRSSLASVCFLNGGLFPEKHRPRPVQRLLASALGPLVARAMGYRAFERSMMRVAGANPPTEVELRDLWTLIERDDGRVALARLIGYMEQRRANRARWVGALVNSGVPRRLLCGAADPVSGRHLAVHYRELVPAADVVVFEGVGHYPQLEAPEAVLEAYLEFRAALELVA